MPNIGDIAVPDPGVSGTFPLVPDVGFGRSRVPEIAVHRFGSANAKIEQRFYLGDGLTRYPVRKGKLTYADQQALRDFWEARSGPYQGFTYNVPDEDMAGGIAATTCRFENEPLSYEHLSDAVATTGVMLVEVPASSPTYTTASTDERFPSSGLESALLDQAQEVVPLITITVKESGYDAIYLSDRECTVDSQLYQARLLRWDGISQAMNAEADLAAFVPGNADKVMRDLAADTSLWRAQVQFSLLHVGTLVRLDLWSGEVVDYSHDEGPEFTLHCSDRLYELTLDFPERTITRSCWKEFDDGANCPYAAEGSGGDGYECDKGFATANGCQAHSMDDYFGGITVKPQGVRSKDNSTGTWGMGRKLLSTVSLVADSIYGQPLQHIYTDVKMPVNCQIAAGREDGDFYAALGIVGAGPISGFSSDFFAHKLDGQPAHGNPIPWGLRKSHGGTATAGAKAEDSDPDTDSDEFSLSDKSGNFTGERAAGVAFVEVRRSDEKGLQLSRLQEHQLETSITGGLGGWVWDAGGDRSWSATITNPVWIAVNAILRARGLFAASEATQEAAFDWDSAEAAAAICNTVVDKIIGAGTETQYKFAGVIAERRPLRDWLLEILNTALGYFVMSGGKVKFGTRHNSSAVEAFTAGNVLAQSISLSARRPRFNHLEGNYGDAEFEWRPNTITAYDIDHASEIGGGSGPQFLKSQMNLVGVSGQSHASRIVTTRLREELGGITAAERKAARYVRFRTTILALAVEPGMVCSLTHDEMPGGSGEFRVRRWRLNGDWSVDVEGETTVDSMYDLTIGPKPDDVTPDPVPAELHEVVLPPQPWFPYYEQPHADDPLLDETDWQFGLTQAYDTLADDTAGAKLRITGRYPVTKTLDTYAPLVGSVSVATTGGSIASGAHVTFVLVATDATGQSSPGSQPASVPVDVGTDTNKIVLSDITWPSGTESFRLYAAVDHNILPVQFGSGFGEGFDPGFEGGGQPSSLEITNVDNVRTRGLPKRNLSTLRVRAKVCEHAGVFGQAISAIESTGDIRIDDMGWTTDEWAGRICSIITDASDGSAQIWNFTVVSNTADTLVVTPDPNDSNLAVEAIDVLIMRAMATSFSSVTIGDAKFQNTIYPTGMNTDEEVGRVVRIIHGTGAGQQRRIVSNTATVLTVDSPWTTTPDATSLFVVEQAAWAYQADVGDLAHEVVDGILTLDMPVANYLERTLTVEVTTLDKFGREPISRVNPRREIYVYGEDPGGLKTGIIAYA